MKRSINKRKVMSGTSPQEVTVKSLKKISDSVHTKNRHVIINYSSTYTGVC